MFRKLVLATCLALPAVTPASGLELGLPMACTIGTDCFVQQMPDLAPGSAVADAFCGTATYDGHDGLDLRVMSMADVTRGVAVVAMADGTVLRGRDGVADRLVTSEADRAAIAGQECGNGLVVDIGGGDELQYCHLRQGSIAVKPGDVVRLGDRLGDVGASGMAQFPHVHVTLRRNGVVVDPVSGRRMDQGCGDGVAAAGSLLSPDILAAFDRGAPSLVALGVAGDAVDHGALSVSGPPAAATTASPNKAGWAWFINLRAGDRVRVQLVGPDGGVVGDQTTEPMDRAKASYAAFAGRRGSPEPGRWRVTAEVLRDGRVLSGRSADVDVR